jgi:hypothetical protein
MQPCLSHTTLPITAAVLQNQTMADRRPWYTFAFTCAALNLLGQSPACAGLGGNAASVTSDANELGGVAHSAAGPRYATVEIGMDNGVHVREFMTPDGLVFAVAWDGPAPPDLRPLLGTSFGAYARALTALKQPGLRRSLRIAAPELVVETAGHLRAYRGRAYLPALIPVGTPTADLR